MLRFTQSKSAKQAKDYFTQSLSTSDYYVSDVESPGRWHGLLADRLGIQGQTTKDVFFALCENRNPVTGEMLTQRTREDRTVAYDLTFSVPKSVSIIAALHDNSGIEDAFQKSVNETMKMIESDIYTRVRAGGKDENRKAEGLIWAEFMHRTARSVDNKTAPDPFMHMHCFAFNGTFDPVQQKIKAAQWKFAKRDAPYYQSLFYKNFTNRLINLGYGIRKQGKSFEIEGVPESVIALMSKRTQQIEKFAKENCIVGENALSQLGAKTRAAKQRGLSYKELKTEWKRQIKENISLKESEATASIRHAPIKAPANTSVKDCVNYALSYSFERASTMSERRVIAQAYMHSLGNREVNIKDIDKAFENDTSIIRLKEDTQNVCTTKAVLKEERHMINLAQQGKNALSPLYHTLPQINLEGQQRHAAEYLLSTKDRVSIFMGAAGSGKTTLMSEVVTLIENTGKKVTVVAPTAQASRIILKNDFKDAETLSKLLIDTKMQEKLKDGVLWIDEAGLLDNKQMIAALELSQKYNARLILGGDTRQHSAVSRGQSLLLLNTVGNIKAAEVNKIYRQRNQIYKEAIEELAKGKVENAFTKLDQIKAIKEVDPLKPNAQLVTDYTETLKTGKSALIVSPIHEQISQVTEEVRQKLKEMGLLADKEMPVRKLKNLNLTEAEKTDWRTFQTKQVIQFNQNLPQIKRGSQWTIAKVENGKVTISDKEGKECLLPLEKADKFNVYQSFEIGLSKGDKVRITQNGYDAQGKRLENGQALKVKRITKSGKAVFESEKSDTEYRFDSDFGHLDYNYCSTSHSSQGHTVDEVFVSMPTNTLVGADSRQFYVSTSRGRDAVHIYTDDKAELFKSVKVTKNELSAIKLAEQSYQKDYALGVANDQTPQPSNPLKPKPKQLNYEPEL